VHFLEQMALLFFSNAPDNQKSTDLYEYSLALPTSPSGKSNMKANINKAMVDDTDSGKIKLLREKPVTVPLYPP
jgi:hypothetical protein